MEALTKRNVVSTLQQLFSTSQPSGVSGTSKYVKGDFFGCLAQKKEEYVRKDTPSREQTAVERNTGKADDLRPEKDDSPEVRTADVESEEDELESLYRQLRDLLKGRVDDNDEKPENAQELLDAIMSLLSQAATPQNVITEIQAARMPEQLSSLTAADGIESALPIPLEAVQAAVSDEAAAETVPVMPAAEEQQMPASAGDDVPQATSGLTSDVRWIENSEKVRREDPVMASNRPEEPRPAALLLNEVMKALPPAMQKQLAGIIQKITMEQGSLRTGIQTGTAGTQPHQEPVLSKLLEDVTRQTLLSSLTSGEEQIPADTVPALSVQALPDIDMPQMQAGLASGSFQTGGEGSADQDTAVAALGEASADPVASLSAETPASSAAVQPKDKSRSENAMARVHVTDLIKTLKDKLPEITAGRNLQIRLDPPNLGEIEISVTVENQKMSIQFNVNSSLVRNLLQENMPQLIESCARRGIDVGNFDVNQNPGQQQENARQGYLSRRGGVFAADEVTGEEMTRNSYMENRLVSILV